MRADFRKMGKMTAFLRKKLVGKSGEKGRRSTVKGYLLLFSAIIFCPCHLPLLLLLAGGTVLGGVLSEYFIPIFGGLLLYFVLAIAYGLRFLREQPEEKSPS